MLRLVFELAWLPLKAYRNKDSCKAVQHSILHSTVARLANRKHVTLGDDQWEDNNRRGAHCSCKPDFVDLPGCAARGSGRSIQVPFLKSRI